MSTADHDAIERELSQLQYGRIDVDWQSHDGAVALAASFRRQAELWLSVVNDRTAAPLLCRAAIEAHRSAEEDARFWTDAAAEHETAGRPA